jgi:hypothetical protein
MTMQRLTSIFTTTGAVLTAALVGYASAANASATIDLIWAYTGTNEISSAITSSNISLQVILTAGPNGSQGAAVSVDYSEFSYALEVVGYMSTPEDPLPLALGTTVATGDRVENINSVSFPPYTGSGLAAGQSHQLGTVTFHMTFYFTGAFEIRSDANGPADVVLDLAGNDITYNTTFNSAFVFLSSVDISCFIDKKCSVGGSDPADSCTAQPGEEVTYHYYWDSQAGADIYDDKLGYIGLASSSDVLTRTTTLTETTTNVATYEVVGPGYCVIGNYADQVTVTVTSPCITAWPQTVIITQAKGQSPANNAKLTHRISGNIVDPGSLGETAHRIEVCAGTEVQSGVTDTTGTPMNTASGSIGCSPAGCAGIVNATEKYQSVSQDGRDKDAITFIPK